MTVPRQLSFRRQPASRSLQTRLTLAYATGSYAAGVFVLLCVAVPLAGVRSAKPRGAPAPGGITGTGNGISPAQLLTGSAVALVVPVPVAPALGRLPTPARCARSARRPSPSADTRNGSSRRC
ncbi:hypothetical protein ACFV2H_51900 [Streptomyces sp. NPDC059629]|uniref:hypothetical protein n=1 Tax=Streptomyces sp. NPDC059629 TaxID=3346889 RepID=UPI0036BCB63E